MNLFRIYFIAALLAFINISCSSTPKIVDEASIATKLRPVFEKMFMSQAPLAPAVKSHLQTVSALPGGPLDFKSNLNKPLVYNKEGDLTLLPGDYIIPVMTYCMQFSASSPSGHIYELSQMQGSRAQIIRALNLRAIPKFSSDDVQILSWSLQSGLSYDEFTKQSQKIVDDILPEFKNQLTQSFLQKISQKWNLISDYSGGYVPRFDEASEDFLSKLGDVGDAIHQIRSFRQAVLQYGNDYQKLKQFIQTPESTEAPRATQWSHISDRVYVRFITQGHYQEIGQLQVRVLSSGRTVNSVADIERVVIDIYSFLADPLNTGTQPLSFSPLFGASGILVTVDAIDSPMIVAALLGAILAAEVIDWDAFSKLANMQGLPRDPTINDLLEHGTQVLAKGHDELEKPLRDKSIITEDTANTSKNEKSGDVREYTKSGGREKLQEDFDKFPEDSVISKDGKVIIKTLSDGTKVIMRPEVDTNNDPTLEIQPSNGSRVNPGLRIKVRY